jgi:hypothetical protein
MIERLRALLDRPLEPRVARAVLLLALAVGVGFAIVLALAGVDRNPPVGGAAAGSTSSLDRSPSARALGPASMPPQDPQDRPGSVAHRRAAAELADHRALQHVPFERDGVSIDLVGARGTRAVLRVEASSVAAARRAWKAFLRRYHGPGDAYAPIFKANRTRRES